MMRTRVSPRRALWVVVVVAAVVLVYENRHLWFGGDDWFILTDRTVLPHAGRLGIFEPHNEHWTTLPVLAFRGLYAFEPQMTVRKIVAIDRDGKLPSLDAVDDRDRLTALARLNLFVGPDSLLRPGAQSAVGLGKVARGGLTQPLVHPIA